MNAERPLPVRRGYPRKVEITRAIEAAKACGLTVGGVRVGPDGLIEVLESGAIQAPQSEFDRWEKSL